MLRRRLQQDACSRKYERAFRSHWQRSCQLLCNGARADTPVGRSANRGTTLAPAVCARKQRWPLAPAHNGQFELLQRIAETVYVRDRDREFNESERRPKADVLASFDAAVAMVIRTIEKQSKQDWLRPYSAEREPESAERFAIFLRCAGHAYHHVGQLAYLSRELRR